MKRLLLLLLPLLLTVSCQEPAQQASYIVQVSLGSWHSADYTAGQVIGRIDSVSHMIPVRDVIIGWTADRGIYRQIGDFLHAKGIRMLLWFPVFAETEEVCDNVPAVDVWGQAPASYDLAAGEGFRFNCPTAPGNADRIISLYDRYFSDCGFDGIFLDRIRSQSFVGGVGGVLSCGCPSCTERFAAEGVDLETVRKEWETRGDDFLSVSSYTPENGFVFSHPVATDFFKAKGHIVSGAVAAIADSLRSRGLIVGMDLYAPFMAPFVGQDYSILAQHADFLKPMLYRKTDAPAGMGFEYELLKKAVPGATGYPELAMDLPFLESQLQALSGSPCSVFPGIEVNYREGIVSTSPEYITESLEAVKRYHLPGAVLSWNIMEAPDAHLACLSPTATGISRTD